MKCVSAARLFLRHRKPEWRDVTKAVRHRALHQCVALLRDGVRLKAGRRRKACAAPGRRPVLGVEVPFAALRLVAVHEQAGLAAHVAVEELHAQLTPPFGPLPEGGMGAEKARVFQHVDVRKFLLQAPFAGFRHDHAGDAVTGAGAGDFALQAVAVGGIIERDIIHRPAFGAQAFGKVAHGGKAEDQLLAVMAHIGGFGHHLRHQHHAAGLVGSEEARQRQTELVTEDRNKALIRFWHAAYTSLTRQRIL
jgi:hypothetical protein